MKKGTLKGRKNIIVFSGLILVVAFWFSLPSPLFNAPTSFVIEDEKGELLNASIAADGQWRFPGESKVSEKFEKCIIAFEDRRFYYHHGFDPVGIARAIRQNLSKGKVTSGASTITMQVIRLSRNKPRNLWQKAMEIILAVRLELSYSKDEILSLYAANAPFGTNVVGLDAASWRYFGRSSDKLSWGEAATLAVLPNSPSLVHPGKNRKKLIQKRNRLIDKLIEDKIIDKNSGSLAKLEPIPEKPHPLPQLAPHLLNRFKSDYAKSKTSSTRVQTTVKTTLQQNVAAILQRYRQQFKSAGINNAAALVLEVETGNVSAYVGNIYAPDDPEAESYVDMIPAFRSPGSTLKPLLYAMMLSEGQLLPHSLVPDIPTQIGGYTPQNFDLGYDGALPASKALSRSLNIPAVKMLQQYKYERFYRELKKLGFGSLNKPADHYGLSLILGGCEVSMWELTGVYASLARSLNHANKNRGKYDPSDYRMPSYLKTELEKNSLEKSFFPDHASVYFTFQAMQEVMRPGEELLWEQFSSSQRIAWKTGTSFGFRDAWAIGVTPKYAVCVWVGNADGEGRPGLTGIDAAAPILFDIFDLLPKSTWFEAPYDKLIQTEVCKASGFKADPICPEKQNLFVPVAATKSKICPYHRLVHLDKSSTYLVNSECESPENMQHLAWFVLPPAMEYYYKMRNHDYRMLPPYKPGCNPEQDLKVMDFIYPKNNAKIYVPVEIDGKRGKVIFNATHREAGTKVFWHLDNDYAATTTDFHQLALSPPPGVHTVTLVDEKGNRVTQRFTVLDKEKN